MACSKPECFRFLLIGMTGSGKSSTGNTILGTEAFETAVSFDSVTANCARRTAQRNGIKIEITDSPGLFDTSKTDTVVCSILMQTLGCMHPGPDVIFFVVKIGRYTDQEHAAYIRFKELLDDRALKYLVVLFTHGDALRGGKTIEGVLSSLSPTSKLQQLLKDCSNRYLVFNNNNSTDSAQVDALIAMARQLRKANKNQPYTCPKYAVVGEKICEEVTRRMLMVEKRELATKKTVQDLNSTIKEKDKKMASLSTDLWSQQRRLKSYEEQMDGLKNEIAELKEEEIERLRKVHEEKEKAIQFYQELTQDMQEEHNELRNEIAQLKLRPVEIVTTTRHVSKVEESSSGCAIL